ncbi:MAG: ABC transporter permease [Clostridia bacterium]|nr:ABC transporter permease [Clostridia bacterium]
MSKKRDLSGLAASLISIAAGLILGFILLLVFNPTKALTGFENMMLTGLKNTDKMAKVLYTAAPLVMTGLAVGFAFKTGLFNIGATGQYTIGAFFALTTAIQFQLPWYMALVMAMIGGAIWGSIPGIFKAFFNVNEVITSIMFNWIGLFAVNLSLNNMPMMLANFWGATNKDRTAALRQANPDGILPKLGLDELMNSNYMNVGIFIAIIFAIIIWIILSKTTFGYELKACGLNRNASTYAGINDKRNIVLSMTIAGAMAGLGGGICYLSGTVQYTMVKTLLPAGFNGIPVALLASSNPIGTIFSALFISYIQVGGDALQPEFTKEIIDIIIAAIIYLSAFSLLMRGIISRGRRNAANVNDEGGGK